MVNYHLKRLAMPRTWLVNRKSNKYSVRPTGSGHPFELGLPVLYVFKDLLKIADNTREMRYILFNKGVFVDGKKIKDHKYLVGYLDVVSIPSEKKYYRIILNDNRKVDVLEINDKEASLKIKKVIGKTIIAGGKVQLNFNDGSNMISNEKLSVGDSVLFDFSENKIKEVLPLKEKATVTLLYGQHSGESGVVENISGQTVFVKLDSKVYEAKKEHVFVLGKTSLALKSVIKN